MWSVQHTGVCLYSDICTPITTDIPLSYAVTEAWDRHMLAKGIYVEGDILKPLLHSSGCSSQLPRRQIAAVNYEVGTVQFHSGGAAKRPLCRRRSAAAAYKSITTVCRGGFYGYSRVYRPIKSLYKGPENLYGAAYRKTVAKRKK